MRKKFQTEITLQECYGSGNHVTVILDEDNLKSAWGKYCRWKRSPKLKAYMASRREQVKRFQDEGATVDWIAMKLKISERIVYRILEELP